MVLKYRTGEKIKKGDHVRYHKNPATLELVQQIPATPRQIGMWRNLVVG